MLNKLSLSFAEISELYYKSGQFEKALEYLNDSLNKLSKEPESSEQRAALSEALYHKIRILSEMEEFDEIDKLQNSFQSLLSQKNSDSYYILALLNFYKCPSEVDTRKTCEAQTQKYLQAALDLAETSKQKVAALTRLCALHFYEGNTTLSMSYYRKIKKLHTKTQSLESLFFATLIQAAIERKQGNLTKSFQKLDICYDLLKSEKNVYFYTYLLWNHAQTLADSNEYAQAIVLLNIALKMCHPKWMKRCHNAITYWLKEYSERSQEYDLAIDQKNNLLLKPQGQKVSLSKQVIISRLLDLFATHQGYTFSKEELCEKVWRTEYNPKKHDNKIYVTVKRLKALIEPSEQSHYIIKSKSGYTLNKNAHIKIIKHHLEGER